MGNSRAWELELLSIVMRVIMCIVQHCVKFEVYESHHCPFVLVVS